ncbi:hypothetical protein M501DRAFT_1003730 [Patellaria atrata CBS 101060]|uniref:Uncharacterized protein n=1 Tax=Patellaria atrata CBS 101060 TaxID=1346257 RepID=A0A9P4SAS0_9PEZI|nr:hypothetical protein M501DRAFT_1003730 [Patellaria atrata CBS 101060]
MKRHLFLLMTLVHKFSIPYWNGDLFRNIQETLTLYSDGCCTGQLLYASTFKQHQVRNTDSSSCVVSPFMLGQL